MHNRYFYWLIALIVIMSSVEAELATFDVSYSSLEGLEPDPKGYVRRDNSDIIKVEDYYYVWYSKMNQRVDPTISNIWYATSPDGHVWTEKGQSLTTGEKGDWDDRYVYTPGILVAEGKYYLYYTAQSTVPRHVEHFTGNMRGIGLAVSDSPDGPWEKLSSNPILVPTDDVILFDSHVVDDSSAIIRNGKYWLYYKGRQIDKPPTETEMGVAIADKPEGPYIKHPSNPLAAGGHEVLVWPEGKGVAALVGMKLKTKQDVPFYLMFAEDGIHFKKRGKIANKVAPWAPGAYRPEAFTDNGQGKMIQWGLHIGGERPDLFLERFDLKGPELKDENQTSYD